MIFGLKFIFKIPVICYYAKNKKNQLSTHLFSKLLTKSICCSCCLVAKSCPTLFRDTMNYSLQVSSVHEISQARILEWVAFQARILEWVAVSSPGNLPDAGRLNLPFQYWWADSLPLNH